MSTLQQQAMHLMRDFFRGEYEEYVGRALPYAVVCVLLFLAAPWVAMAIYGLRYGIFQRPGEMKAMALSPFLTFFFFLTDPATPGFDQRLMRMFHPSLLQEGSDGGSVQRGLIRAMSRCLIDNFGPVTHIPRDTVVLKKDDQHVNCIALVDFEKAKQVRCQLSWKPRPGIVKRYKAATGRYPERKGKEATTINGIRMAFPHTFQVTSFHVDPKKGEEFNILQYVILSDFDDFGALFVERLFQRPPTAAAVMMVPPLQHRYDAENIAVLQRNVQTVVDACGGLASPVDDVDVDQTSCRAVYSTAEAQAQPSVAEPLPGEPKSVTSKNEVARRAMDGIDMEYLVKGKTRNMEVYLRLTFSGLRAMVARYELRLLADERAQVIVDHDSGNTAVVG
ncbi:hypothetical protein ABB37_05486 [Leptomonas pyrrhocoris]|uniref:Uncharacterized protein n=1 Tax=Leptomonas pyrrhocoris TaxID=157538 RepID=A0A0M9G0L5_LEPPY|nr:hypothetical protein ABB37_05486 [Leptomonas pyrrhocoris]XP_015658165.1 hypothetical protein ABB37_05486 [Leptomonas pyrrhocoris]KPA79725.1 hypothetical protein ABB37_05486 [Leptomonas pyrrhocoris]KPA79726.1 hypothetical protein ABB37_05486 [Leptomonas pyrrhocoris]|eukprot:XP_015658164.1 hypothetical protein ABB37_05486 [Leptomonas pyrrhocoris]